MLATSRQPLSIPGEAIWPVPPLDVDTDAVVLFRDRARLARPDLTELDDHQAVAEICRHLDGLPLAIELAAAQVQAFDPADIAARLGDRFRLLQRPTAESDRHRNLRATIAWSHDLLSPAAQIVLRRLAVFIGSFDLSAAETVCADLHLDAAEVAALLGELVRNSLVVRDTAGRRDRYRLLETVRVYALEQLDAAGDQTRPSARPTRPGTSSWPRQPPATSPDRTRWHGGDAWTSKSTTCAPPSPSTKPTSHTTVSDLRSRCPAIGSCGTAPTKDSKCCRLS